MRKIILIVLMMSILSGCAEMNSQFDCPKKPGINCEMLDEVNDRINRGEIGNDSVKMGSCKTCEKSSYTTFSSSNALVMPSAWSPNINHQPLRYGETVQRVWMAPYEDTVGNYHQESEVFTIVKPGHWIGHPVKAIDESE